jgi:hypothetical protein
MHPLFRSLALILTLATASMLPAQEGPEPTEAEKTFFLELKRAALAGDRAWVSGHVCFPVRAVIAGRTRMIANAQEFETAYAGIMTLETVNAIRRQAPEALVRTQHGVLVGDGEVWLGEDPSTPEGAPGILGSYGVAWFGIRINTVANSRTAFSALKGNPLATLGIPLRSGMSVGLLLVCVELFFMICILVFLPLDLVGPCFIGFAIGESLGASALRICGGIFTKIADIGSDLMKIVFKLPEDDPKNPGVIADCTGDNAGDSVGPTADGLKPTA